MRAGERLVWVRPTEATSSRGVKTHRMMESSFQGIAVDSCKSHRTVGDTTNEGALHDGLAL